MGQMENENKARFVSSLGDLLMLYSRERVTGIEYKTTESGLELAVIYFARQNTIVQDITGDSCVAIMQDIAKALQ